MKNGNFPLHARAVACVFNILLCGGGGHKICDRPMGSQNIAEVLSDINELPKWWPLTYQYCSHIPVILKVHPNYITGLDDVIK